MRSPVILALSLVLAGCQTMGFSSDDGPRETPEGTAPAPVALAPKAPSLPVATTALVGMTGEALQSAWGEPSLRRTEAGAEMWQYGGQGTCTLLVYFYATASSVMTVTHAEAVPGGSDEAALANCAKAAGKPPLKPIS